MLSFLSLIFLDCNSSVVFAVEILKSALFGIRPEETLPIQGKSGENDDLEASARYVWHDSASFPAATEVVSFLNLKPCKFLPHKFIGRTCPKSNGYSKQLFPVQVCQRPSGLPAQLDLEVVLHHHRRSQSQGIQESGSFSEF